MIEGFKSYKEQTVAEPFSRQINVVGERLVSLRSRTLQSCTAPLPFASRLVSCKAGTAGRSELIDVCSGRKRLWQVQFFHW